MAGRITKVLLVLAVLHHALRADVQAAEPMAEVMRQPEEQHSQTTWLAMAGNIVKILMVGGIFHYALPVDLPTVKVTEELLRQHEKEHNKEMEYLQIMQQKMQEQSRPTLESMLHSGCQQWSFWNCVRIILVLFVIYSLFIKKKAVSGSGSQEKKLAVPRST